MLAHHDKCERENRRRTDWNLKAQNCTSRLRQMQDMPPRTFLDDRRELLGTKILLKTDPKVSRGALGTFKTQQIFEGDLFRSAFRWHHGRT